jgi:hypothetical protein
MPFQLIGPNGLCGVAPTGKSPWGEDKRRPGRAIPAAASSTRGFRSGARHNKLERH